MLFDAKRFVRPKRSRRSGQKSRLAVQKLEARNLLTVLVGTGDAWISGGDGQQNSNTGGESIMSFGVMDHGATHTAMVVKFDDPVGGFQGKDATLRLYLDDLYDEYGAPGSLQVNVFALNEAWAEGTGSNIYSNDDLSVTWNQPDTGQTWAPGGNYDSGNPLSPTGSDAIEITASDEDSWISIPLGTLATDISNGLIIVPDQGQYSTYYFASRETDASGSGFASLAPELIVDDDNSGGGNNGGGNNGGGNSGGAEATLDSAGDAWISGGFGQQNSNTGGESVMSFGVLDHGETHTAMVVKFDQPANGFQGNDATLKLYLDDLYDEYGAPGTLQLSVFALNEAWVEGTGSNIYSNDDLSVTWNQPDTGASWAPGGNFDSGNPLSPTGNEVVEIAASDEDSWISIPLGTLSSDISNGLIVVPTGQYSTYYFASRETDPTGSGFDTLAPQLVLNEGSTGGGNTGGGTSGGEVGWKVNDVTIVEPDSGVTQVNVRVDLLGYPNGAPGPLSVHYKTVPYTAEKEDAQIYDPTNPNASYEDYAKDYESVSGILEFNTGDSFKNIQVNVVGDNRFESDEKFRIQLSEFSDNRVTWTEDGAEISGVDVVDASAFVTIVNDDTLADDPDQGLLERRYTSDEFDQSYVGQFQLQRTEDLPVSGLNFELTEATNGLAIRKGSGGQADSLYLAGFRTTSGSEGHNGAFGEFVIPDLSNIAAGDTPIATLQSHVLLENDDLETSTDGTSSAPNFHLNDGGGVVVQDAIIVGNRLLASTGLGYDAGLGYQNSHFAIDTLDLNSVSDGNVTGLYDTTSALASLNSPDLDGTHAGFFAGYMTEIPTQWQPLLGGTHLMGANGLNGVNNTSQGPSAMVFDAEAVGTGGNIDPHLLMYYTNGTNEGGQPLQDEWVFSGAVDPQTYITDPLFNPITNVIDAVFVPDTRTVLFIGDNAVNETTGESYFAYGEGQDWDDRERGGGIYQGLVSPGGNYAFQVWAYDVYDLAAAKNGELKPWDLRPHDVWNFDLPETNSNREIDGGAFDPETGLLYIATTRPENNHAGQVQKSTAVHVFDLSPAVAGSANAGVAPSQPMQELAPSQSAFLSNSAAIDQVHEAIYARDPDSEWLYGSHFVTHQVGESFARQTRPTPAPSVIDPRDSELERRVERAGVDESNLNLLMEIGTEWKNFFG